MGMVMAMQPIPLQIDEGVQITYYHDADGDGYGNAADTLMACEAP